MEIVFIQGGNFVCEDGGKIQPMAIGVAKKIQQVATRVAKVVRKSQQVVIIQVVAKCKKWQWKGQQGKISQW
jgi:hypothetical protein